MADGPQHSISLVYRCTAFRPHAEGWASLPALKHLGQASIKHSSSESRESSETIATPLRGLVQGILQSPQWFLKVSLPEACLKWSRFHLILCNGTMIPSPGHLMQGDPKIIHQSTLAKDADSSPWNSHQYPQRRIPMKRTEGKGISGFYSLKSPHYPEPLGRLAEWTTKAQSWIRIPI